MFHLLIVSSIIPYVYGSGNLLLRPVGSEVQSSSSLKDGCAFGVRRYSIGQTWHPDIAPLGVLRCVLCSCNKHPKRSGNYGKVVCRSTRHRCPKKSCTNPEYRPVECCPVCPSEFVALLTPPKSLSSKPLSRQNGVARVHITLVEDSLRISIRYEGHFRPKTLIFCDRNNNVLRKINIHKKYISGKTICLQWNGLNSQEIQLLEKKRVTVVLEFKKKRTVQLAGQVIQYNSYSEDAFESILQAEKDLDAHMAILATINLSRNGKYLHVNMKHTELTHAANKPIYATVEFIKSQRNGKTHLLHTINVTSLQSNGGKEKVTWSLPSDQQLKWLARGIIMLKVSVTAGSHTVTMTGKIGIKRTCNTMYALLSGRDVSRPTITGASGYTSLDLQDNGQLHYKISVVGLMQPILEITLEMNRKRVVKKIARHHVVSHDPMRAQISGVWERPSVSEICALYSGSMSVNVRTGLYRRGELKGFTKQLPYAGHHIAFEDFPYILSGDDVVPSTRTGASGVAWFALDRHCSLHYSILTKGLNEGRGKKKIITADLEGFAFAGEQPMNHQRRTNSLETFNGDMAWGVHRDLDQEFLINLIRGRVYLQVSSHDNPRGELRGQIKLEPGQCKLPQATHIEAEGSCTSEGRTYFDGEAWFPDYDKKCTTCSCKDKQVTCHPIVCSPQNCSEAMVTLPDMCCPVCPVLEKEAVMVYSSRSPPQIKGCFVDQGKKFYPSDIVWHPYIEPFGNMKCVVCSCLANSNEISCSKLQCPKLTCPVPIKKHPTNCCFQCPDKNQKVPQQNVCRFGHHTYSNGARWSPRIPPFGVLKCITCQCQNGDTNCSSVKCPPKHCKTSFAEQDKGCCVPC